MSQVKDTQVNAKLELVWEAYYEEYERYIRKTLGKVLTIIDATIVDEKQNKNIKDIITKSFWEDENYMFRMAGWFNWFHDNVEIRDREDQETNQPYQLEKGIVVPFDNFKK